MANSQDLKDATRPALLSGSQINWNRVYQFAEVAACGSIKAAAERLDLSPSTLSEHISHLEEELSLKLFIREHRRLRLTEAGARLAIHAKQVFEASKRLIDVVSPIQLGTYPISVGLVPCPSLQLAYGIAGDFLADSGPIEMKLIHTAQEDLEDGLLHSRLDFGFTNHLPTHKALRSHLLASSSIRFFVAPKLAHKHFSELITELPFLLCGPESPARNLVDQLFFDADLERRSIINSDHPGVLIDFCLRGLGIGVFSEEQVRKSNGSALHMIPFTAGSPQLKDNLYVAWARDGENNAAVQHLHRFLRTLRKKTDDVYDRLSSTPQST